MLPVLTSTKYAYIYIHMWMEDENGLVNLTILDRFLVDASPLAYWLEATPAVFMFFKGQSGQRRHSGQEVTQAYLTRTDTKKHMDSLSANGKIERIPPAYIHGNLQVPMQWSSSSANCRPSRTIVGSLCLCTNRSCESRRSQFRISAVRVNGQSCHANSSSDPGVHIADDTSLSLSPPFRLHDFCPTIRVRLAIDLPL